MVVFQQCYVSVLYMYPEWLRSYGCISTEVRLILVEFCFYCSPVIMLYSHDTAVLSRITSHTQIIITYKLIPFNGVPTTTNDFKFFDFCNFILLR